MTYEKKQYADIDTLIKSSSVAQPKTKADNQFRILLKKIGLHYIVYVSAGLIFLFGVFSLKTYFPAFSIEQKYFALCSAAVLAIFFGDIRARSSAFVNSIVLPENLSTKLTIEDVSKAMAYITDLDRLLRLTHRILSRRLKLKSMSIILYNERSNTYVAKIGGSIGKILGENSPIIRYLLIYKNPLLKKGLYNIIQQKTIDDQPMAEMINMIAELDSIGANVCVPCIIKNKLIGIISLGAKTNNKPFEKKEIDLVQLLSVQGGAAIENALFFNSIKQKSQQIKSLFAASRKISSAMNPQEKIDLIAATIVSSISNITCCSIDLYDRCKANVCSTVEENRFESLRIPILNGMIIIYTRQNYRFTIDEIDILNLFAQFASTSIFMLDEYSSLHIIIGNFSSAAKEATQALQAQSIERLKGSLEVLTKIS